ncbi:TetR family transcriptional regulator C-terminal domain-containing protein [Nonomuraea wenchangensis]
MSPIKATSKSLRSILPTSSGTMGAATAATMLGTVDHEAGRGCFVVNTATELGATDPAVRQRTEAAFEGTRKTLASLLRRGIRDGDLPATLDVEAAVESLFTTVLGLRVRERAGHDAQRLATAIDFTIRTLAGPAT